MNFVLRCLRAPVLHFLLIGALLFFLQGLWTGAPNQTSIQQRPEDLIVSADQIKRMKGDFIAKYGRSPSPQDLQAAVDQFINEEILYRQARAMGLNQNNPAVRGRLVQLARFVAEDPKLNDDKLYHQALKLGLDQSDLVVRRQMATMMRLILEKIPTQSAPAVISDADYKKYYQDHADEFLIPERFSLTHIYFSRDRRGARGQQAAEQVLKQFQNKATPPAKALELGDPFLGGRQLRHQSAKGLEAIFGPSFTAALPNIKQETWSGPLASSYGWHLVWLEMKIAPQAKKLELVRRQIRQGIIRQRRERRFQDAMARLRSTYEIKVQEDG